MTYKETRYYNVHFPVLQWGLQSPLYCLWVTVKSPMGICILLAYFLTVGWEVSCCLLLLTGSQETIHLHRDSAEGKHHLQPKQTWLGWASSWQAFTQQGAAS